jgi:MHS family proline/betaine transporter-like MFS transporter
MSNKISKKVILSCFLAGCLEMYDFVIFAFLAPVIHKNYLSFLDKNTGLIITYMLFAAGFLFRPLGSVIFGHIGDKYGRKKALAISVTLMGIASLSLSILPRYEDIGIISCFLIMLIRIIQGLSVGGEYSGAAIYAIEHSSRDKIGLIGSTVLAGTTLGILLATFISDLLQNPDLPEYSWRFAFLLGFGLSIIGYFIRKYLGESPAFEASNQIKLKVPLLHGIRNFKKEILACVFLSGANNANYYFALVFVPNYLKAETSNYTGFNSYALAFFMLILEPTFGWLSDRWNRNKILIAVCTLLGIYNLFFFDMLYNSTSVTGTIYIIVSALLLSILVASVNIFVLEIFPTNCRYSCGAFSYSLGAALFGGTTPLVCTLITEHIGNKPIYIGMYISLISVLGAMGGILILNKNKRQNNLSLQSY